MNRPPVLTYLIGNPIISILILCGGGWCLYQWSQGLAPPIAALIAVALMVWSGQASQQLGDYDNWQRAWKAMGPPTKPGVLSRPGPRRVLGGLIVLVVGYYLFTHQTTPANQLALGWLVLVVLCLSGFWLLGGLYRLVRRRLQLRARRKTECVTLCMPVAAEAAPTLAQAYQQLPEHCWRVLKR